MAGIVESDRPIRSKEEKTTADKILDFMGKFSLVQPKGGQTMSDLAPWNEPEDMTAKYNEYKEQEKTFNRGQQDNILEKVMNWFGKSSPYTKPRAGGGSGAAGIFTNKPGYKY